MDWKSWNIALFFLCMNVSNGGLNTFSAQIVSGFGFNALNTVLIGMPTGVIQAVSSILAALPPRYIKDSRCLSAAAVRKSPSFLYPSSHLLYRSVINFRCDSAVWSLWFAQSLSENSRLATRLAY